MAIQLMSPRNGTILILLTLLLSKIYFTNSKETLPLVAIANYGPHASLDNCIKGIKAGLEKEGFIEDKTVRYEIKEVGFDPTLIPQMLTQLRHKRPKVMVVLTTPVAQLAKKTIKEVPLIYSAITDPKEAGLQSMTGSCDKQNMTLLLKFAKTLLPHAKKVGMLYSTSEMNDKALLSMMRQAAQKASLDLVAIPIDEARDIPTRIQAFSKAHPVDFIYVGTSGPIQPALPVIAAYGKKMHIPIINVDKQAVISGLVLASFGVNYQQVGQHTAELILPYLKEVGPYPLESICPKEADHQGFINQSQSQALGVLIPKELTYAVIK